jgi:hypothetical protein
MSSGLGLRTGSPRQPSDGHESPFPRTPGWRRGWLLYLVLVVCLLTFSAAAVVRVRGERQALDDHATRACAIAIDIVDRYRASSPEPYFGSPEKWTVFADQEFEALYEASQSNVPALREIQDLAYKDEFTALYHWCGGR